MRMKTPPIQLVKPPATELESFTWDREISKVMGHLGAGWLERPQREQAGTHRFTGRKLEPSDHLTMWST